MAFTFAKTEYNTDSASDLKYFLGEFNYYDLSVSALSEIIRRWEEAKGEYLLPMFRNHPNWNEEDKMIIFSEDYRRGVSPDVAGDFFDWVRGHLDIEDKIAEDVWSEVVLNDIKANAGSAEPMLVSEKVKETLEDYFPEVKIAVGQKLSRAVNKVCQTLGLTSIREVKKIWQNGEYRDKDFGYNYQFALFGDAINPVSISQYTCISLNIFDYLGMSFGNGWSSCHTIDKEGVRGSSLNGNHTYNGCYSSGTLSYALDPSTVIFYTVDRSYQGKMYLASKEKRCNFHISEDGVSLVQGRLYPDARDNNDYSYGGQFRHVMQNVIAKCLSEPNLWIKGDSGSKREWIEEDRDKTNYSDYFQYDDTNISFRKGNEPRMVYIGHAPICPCCGGEHGNQEDIRCEDCEGETLSYCERCGSSIYEGESYIYCEDNDCYYCCEECAIRDDVVYCKNSDHYRTYENCYCDAYDGNYYDDEPEVSTEDGYSYYSEGNAINDDCIYCEYDNVWYHDGCNVLYSEAMERYFDKIANDWIETSDGVFFPNEDEAFHFGYVLTDNGDYVKESETVDIDGMILTIDEYEEWRTVA